MRRFTSIFTTDAEPKPQNRRAILFSVVVSLAFLGLSALLFGREQPRPLQRSFNCPAPTPIASPKVEVKSEPPNAKFRIVPSNFMHVDFENRSYGTLRAGTGDKINLTLVGGRYEYTDGYEVGGEWFDFSEVYFTDVTGDESPEAIVLLSHVQCGVSCDGGSDLLFVYETYGQRLKELWRYETGCLAYGCGLKSLTIMRKQISVQLFGKCLKSRTDYDGFAGKYRIPDTTLLNFRLSGDRFVKKESAFFTAPVRDVGNYTPEIHIIE